MTEQTELRRRGLALIDKLHGGHAGEAMMAEVADVCPAFAEITVDVAMGTIMSRPGLDLATRELILVAACVMLGHAMPQLRAHAEAALKMGATRQQVTETILQLVLYASGPSVRNSLVELKDLLAEPH